MTNTDTPLGTAMRRGILVIEQQQKLQQPYIHIGTKKVNSSMQFPFSLD